MIRTIPMIQSFPTDHYYRYFPTSHSLTRAGYRYFPTIPKSQTTCRTTDPMTVRYYPTTPKSRTTPTTRMIRR